MCCASPYPWNGPADNVLRINKSSVPARTCEGASSMLVRPMVVTSMYWWDNRTVQMVGDGRWPMGDGRRAAGGGQRNQLAAVELVFVRRDPKAELFAHRLPHRPR